VRLKSDVFGTIERLSDAAPGTTRQLIRRDTRAARWWARGLARHLARREARALRALAGITGVPALAGFERGVLLRQWIDGEPMQRARPRDPAYFRAAMRLLRRLHRARVAHNDLAKEPNWLVTPERQPALVDFQLALVSRRRGRCFRMLARDDIRHLLKHKRTYCPERLTRRELAILARPSPLARVWMATGKKVYLFITRRLLGWSDREGAGDRRDRGGL
jgi:RIO-like serine/threonine protein kinase